MKEEPQIPLEKLQEIAGTSGLASDRVEAMRTQYGANVMTPPVRDPLWRQYLEKFDDPIIKILLFAVAVSTVVAVVKGSGLLDTVGIIAAILLSTGIAFFNEYRSSKEFDVLNAHRDDTAIKVVRDGHPTNVASRDIVVGDLILLEAGDAVPADGWILSSDELVADESAFTGESEPVRKKEEERLLKGTYVTAGKGRMLSSAVGDSAQMGQIAAALGIDHATQTPLEKKLEELAGVISKFGYAMAILICSTLLIRGLVTGEVTGLNIDTVNNVLHYFMLAVVIVVAAVPEGLPMSVALSLSLAMRKMTRANCLVRRLIACETIGSATTICTDKTGTLTKNQMLVASSSAGNPVIADSIPETPIEWITLNAAVNGTAYLDTHDGRTVVIGNSTEGALLRWLAEYNLDYAQIRAEQHETKQFLFDGNRKRMSTIVRIEGRSFILVKGAPEILAALCTEKPDLEGVSVLARRAMRTLAFAHREITGSDESETNLVWDGFVGIRDQLRDNIGDAVATCQQAGIRVRMVTGDNPETARAIAQESGIHKGGTVVPGPVFRAMSPDEQVTAAQNLDIMARAEPMDKLLLVQALQKSGDVVAVTGDGTNDAPALKHANVGFAMGIAGTEVAREASDIILLDDSFASITQAVWWGRSLYENIQRFLLFQLTINFCACLLVFLAPLLGYQEPFSIIQILWINIIMDTLAAFALCSEAPHAGLLKRQPIPQNATIITPFMWLSIIVTGAVLIIGGLLQLATGFLGGSTPEEIRTVFFSAFIIAAVWNGINCRALDGKMPAFFKGNPMFFVIMGLVVVLQIVLVQYGCAIFNTVPLSALQWVTIILATAFILVVGFVLRVAYHGYMAGKSSAPA
ncbi:calcium-translocating P-type ATPase, PMCA-type [Methanoregula sp.]|uniref:calcium-translocating P-type ATPase, PMCA-type n=1 Tax=Methanoregula sp. TaxID=2052170 RepID=UPI00236CCC38|nr:calcium-translocating P-type ATPase, PMCA-type [Methanoregula sp.]MDD1685770.1 calcium-translocating P-type ATPase, PMCA-type [Methanoregula sp.]